jgi:hypothetical protein
VRVTAARAAPAHAAAGLQRPAGRRVMLARHVARTTSWGPLLAGCVTGIGVTVALRIFAGPIESPSALGLGVRASFVPVVAGLAFLLHDPYRQLTRALPARTWLPSALRLAMALPALGLSSVVQLLMAARALAVDLQAARPPAGSLPWLALTAELAAWCAVALALAAGLERTRWHDLAGLVAAVCALAVVAALALAPLHLLPGTIIDMTSAQQRQWAAAWQLWAAVAAAAAVIAGWAAGDPWRRVAGPVMARMSGS